jgi:hypothetical protein
MSFLISEWLELEQVGMDSQLPKRKSHLLPYEASQNLICMFRYLEVDPTINLTVLESEESLGGTWSAARVYKGLLNQAPYSLYESTDFPMDQRDPDEPGGGIPSERIHSYLKEYAEMFNIADKIRYNTTVERVRRIPNGAGWEVHIEGGSQPILCDKLIVATGHTSRENIPDIPKSNFTPFTFHAKYLGKHFEVMNAENTKVQTITVLGGGKSAYEAANAAAVAGKNVNWIIRKSGEGPGMLIDITAIKSKRVVEFAFSRAGAALQTDPFSQGKAYRFLHSGQNAFGYWLCWMFWGMATKFMIRKWKYDSNPNMKKLKPDYLDHAYVSILSILFSVHFYIATDRLIFVPRLALHPSLAYTGSSQYPSQFNNQNS